MSATIHRIIKGEPYTVVANSVGWGVCRAVSKTDRFHRSYQVFQVRGVPDRCSCADFTHRCLGKGPGGTNLCCKHMEEVLKMLREQHGEVFGPEKFDLSTNECVWHKDSRILVIDASQLGLSPGLKPGKELKVKSHRTGKVVTFSYREPLIEQVSVCGPASADWRENEYRIDRNLVGWKYLPDQDGIDCELHILND